jgi:hypothetical protein
MNAVIEERPSPMSALPLLNRLTHHVTSVLDRAALEEAGWNCPRRTFAHRIVAGIELPGDVMLTGLVRALPCDGVAMDDRYKAFDCLLDRKRHFAIRLDAGKSARLLRVPPPRQMPLFGRA